MNRRNVIDSLRQLQKVAPRADWVSATHDLLLAEVRRQGEVMPVVLPAATWSVTTRFWQSVTQFVRQPVVSFVAVLGAVMVSSLMVNAAFYSLPGEPLYRMKLAFERTQLAMVSDTTRKAELKLEFARNRVKELGHLVSRQADRRSTPKEVSRVVTRFAEEVASMRKDLQRLPADQRAAFKMAVSVEQAGTELAQQLQNDGGSGDEVNQVVQQALAAAEQTSFSTLEAAISATASSSQELPTDDVRRYLNEKVERLRAQLPQVDPVATTTVAVAAPTLADALDTAQAAIAAGNFTEALGIINSVRQQLEPAKPAAAPEAATDGGTSSTTAETVPTAGDNDLAGETTQGLLP